MGGIAPDMPVNTRGNPQLSIPSLAAFPQQARSCRAASGLVAVEQKVMERQSRGRSERDAGRAAAAQAAIAWLRSTFSARPRAVRFMMKGLTSAWTAKPSARAKAWKKAPQTPWQTQRP
jgi:hypothetical protein